MIRRYDAVMSEKCSKHQLKQVLKEHEQLILNQSSNNRDYIDQVNRQNKKDI